MNIKNFYNSYIGSMIVQSMPDKFLDHVTALKSSKGYSDLDIEVTCGSVFAAVVPYEEFKERCKTTINRELFCMGSFMCGVESVLDNLVQRNYNEAIGSDDSVKSDILDAVRGKGSASLANVIKKNVVSAIKKDETEREKLDKKKADMVNSIEGTTPEKGDTNGYEDDESILDDSIGNEVGNETTPESEETYMDDPSVSESSENPEEDNVEYGESTGLKRAKFADVPDNQFGIPATYSFPLNSVKRIHSAEAYFHKAPEEYKDQLSINIEKAMRDNKLGINRKAQWYPYFEKATSTGIQATYSEGVSVRQNVRVPIRKFKDLAKLPGIPKKYLKRVLHLRDGISENKSILRNPNSTQAERDTAMNKLNMLLGEYNALVVDMMVPLVSLTAGAVGGIPMFIGYGVGWIIGTLGDVMFGEQIEKFVDDIYDTIRGERAKTSDPKVIKALEDTENAVKDAKTSTYKESPSFMQGDGITTYTECNLLISTDVSQLCITKAVDMSGEPTNGNNTTMNDNAKLIASALIVSFHLGATLGISCDTMVEKIRAL